MELGLGSGLEERAWLGVGLGLGLGLGLEERAWLGVGLELGLGLGLEERAWCRLTLIEEAERVLVGRLAWRGGGWRRGRRIAQGGLQARIKA